MNLKDILSISGYQGLYKYISQGRQGIIVESFEDKKRTCIYTTHKVTTLEDIAIYTSDKEVPLADVFKKIFEKENGGEAINHKSSDEELKKYLAGILPDYDRDRVYVSDIKKVVTWYNILHKHDLLKFDDEDEKEKEKEKKKEGISEETAEGPKVETSEGPKVETADSAKKPPHTISKFKESEAKGKIHTKKIIEHKGKKSQKV
jgi:hypothetical protein